MKTFLVILVLAALVAMCSAKKKCKYQHKGKWSKCVDGKSILTKELKEGSDPSCEKTKTREKTCSPGRKEKCKYLKGNWSECDTGNNTQTRIMTLHKGGPECLVTKTKTRKCKKVPGCKYSYTKKTSKCNPETNTFTRDGKLKKKQRAGKKIVPRLSRRHLHEQAGKEKKCHYEKATFGPCHEDTNKRTKTRKLKPDESGSKCVAEHSKKVPCKKKHGCKYSKGAWGPCNPATKKMTRILTLEQGGGHCVPKKTREKRCKKVKAGRKACKYKRGPWSQCDPVTNQMLRTMTLKRGNRDKCQPIKKVTRRCLRRAALSAARIHSKCKYEFADWQQCDLSTNTMTRTMNLIQGDPDKCPPTKELKHKCRKPCKFRKGRWSACHPTTHLMTRVDTLVKGDTMFCKKSRQITKKCKKGKRKCQYDIGDWSECDSTTNERTRTKTLKKGNPAVCKATIEMKKACSRPNGKERCFFGKWGVYGPCMNGVMTKTRELIQGGTECERKAVKTKACA